MANYGIGLLPLLLLLHYSSDNPARHVGFADHLNSGGKLRQLRAWLDILISQGKTFGYNVEPTKSWLVVKEDLHEEACEVFRDTGVNITTHGKK